MVRKATWRLVLAIVAAPLMAAPIVAIAVGAILTCPERACDSSVFGFAVYLGIFLGAIFGVPTMLLGGLPAHHLLVKKGKTHPLAYALVGAVVGLPATIITLLVMQRGALDFTDGGATCAAGTAAGALCALIFWLIRRPDRDAPNPGTRAP